MPWTVTIKSEKADSKFILDILLCLRVDDTNSTSWQVSIVAVNA